MRARRLATAVGATALLIAGTATAGNFTEKGSVVSIKDGMTLTVKIGGGGAKTVRLIGLVIPSCSASKALSATTSLARGENVTLKGEPALPTRSGSATLAYTWLSGKDLGFQLISRGAAKVDHSKRFSRQSAYDNAASKAPAQAGCGPTPTPKTNVSKPSRPSGGKCEPGYSPCLPSVGDLDCGDIPDSAKPIRVTGGDPYRLDRDGDGVACEAD